MKIYIYTSAQYTEDGELLASSQAFLTLEGAKAALYNDYRDASSVDPDVVDEDENGAALYHEQGEPLFQTTLQPDGLYWNGDSGGNHQAFGEITEQELL